jgi:hypothetical protein
MWADDIHWLPGVIAGGSFRAYFHFDGDTMLSKNVHWNSTNPHLAPSEF